MRDKEPGEQVLVQKLSRVAAQAAAQLATAILLIILLEITVALVLVILYKAEFYTRQVLQNCCCQPGRDTKSQKFPVSRLSRANFQDCMETFQAAWKLFRFSGKFTESKRKFQTVKLFHSNVIFGLDLGAVCSYIPNGLLVKPDINKQMKVLEE